MAGPDPDDPNFAATFVADITATMTMGLPEESVDRPTFYFATLKEHPAPTADASGRPWDFRNLPTGPDDPDPVQVPCSVEAREGESDETAIGTFDADEYILGFLPEDWELIKEFTYVTLGQRRFVRSKQLAPVGLYDVTFRQIRVEAKDT